MAINIKDEETDRLVRQLAELMDQPITLAVRHAVSARLDQLRRRQRLTDGPDLADIIARARARGVLDHRTEEEILGLGDDGLPT